MKMSSITTPRTKTTGTTIKTERNGSMLKRVNSV